MLFFKKNRKIKEMKESILAAAISDSVNSAIYMDLLKENNIPFICRNQGAGGYMKILTGGLFVTDCIYVNPEHLQKAKALYEMYIENNTQNNEEETDVC